VNVKKAELIHFPEANNEKLKKTFLYISGLWCKEFKGQKTILHPIYPSKADKKPCPDFVERTK